MKNNVWYLTSPDGRVVGASARSARLALTEVDLRRISRVARLALEDQIDSFPHTTRYEAAGYVLALVEVPAHA